MSRGPCPPQATTQRPDPAAPETTRLGRLRWARLLRRHLQQPEQPHVLRPQPGQLPLKLCSSTGRLHTDTISCWRSAHVVRGPKKVGARYAPLPVNAALYATCGRSTTTTPGSRAKPGFRALTLHPADRNSRAYPPRHHHARGRPARRGRRSAAPGTGARAGDRDIGSRLEAQFEPDSRTPVDRP